MIRANARWRLVAIVGAAGLVLAACGGDDDTTTTDTATDSAATGTPLYLVDGNIGNGPLGELPPGTLDGVKGTLPGAEASSDFKDRLNEIDPSLKKIGYSYGPESYDAAMVVILASIAAKSDAGRDIAEQMQDVSTGGNKCSTFDDCNKMLEQGDDIDYDGQSGPIEFDDFGDPTSAFVGIYQYDAENRFPV